MDSMPPEGVIEITVRDHEWSYRWWVHAPSVHDTRVGRASPLGGSIAELQALAIAFSDKTGDIGNSYRKWKESNG